MNTKDDVEKAVSDPNDTETAPPKPSFPWVAYILTLLFFYGLSMVGDHVTEQVYPAVPLQKGEKWSWNWERFWVSFGVQFAIYVAGICVAVYVQRTITRLKLYSARRTLAATVKEDSFEKEKLMEEGLN
ncbi:hypothetical protein CJU90_2067 [Yarrowia sp. C11]|nr:hypothetical protein CKK34_6094 [Yarrowia sp. E02]KAG5371997.1 hypothetical protein CJU90_2067 [Yarrowia sp. C11]